jgi:hypothetical protein
VANGHVAEAVSLVKLEPACPADAVPASAHRSSPPVVQTLTTTHLTRVAAEDGVSLAVQLQPQSDIDLLSSSTSSTTLALAAGHATLAAADREQRADADRKQLPLAAGRTATAGMPRPLFAAAARRDVKRKREVASDPNYTRGAAWRATREQLPPEPRSCDCPRCRIHIAPTQTSVVRRAQLAADELRQTLDRLSQRGAVSVPDVAAAICAATRSATTPFRPPPPKRGCADNCESVFDGSPFTQCAPGPWAVGRRPGDPHEGPLCTCGVRCCVDRGHFPVVDVVELYDMHCKYVCDAHEQAADGTYRFTDAHASCSIHTLLTLLSGAWVPWHGDPPVEQQCATRIVTAPDSSEGHFVSCQLAKGIEQDLWEKLSPADAADVAQCTIIEAGFAALVGKLRLSEKEAVVVNDAATVVDVSAVNTAALQRAERFVAELAPSAEAASRVGKAAFAQAWTAQGGGSKFRFCVAHDKFLNRGAPGWPLLFPTANAVLETASPDDVFITRDHKSGYSVVPIRPDQRRFFCFYDPVTGDVYRCKRLDFGWALSPGIFCAFTAELNAIISSRLISEVDRHSLSRYYVDDCIARVPRGGSTVTMQTPDGLRSCSSNEAVAVSILDDVARRANFPTSPEKVRWGSTVVYLGLVISTATRSAFVVPSKLFKALTMLHVLRGAIAAGRIDVPVSFALKAAGNMQWLAQNFRHGRLHTAALWLAAEQLRTRRVRHVRQCPGLAATCEWWAVEAAAGRLLPHRFMRALDIPSLSLSFSPVAPEARAVAAVPRAHPRARESRPVVAVLTDATGKDEGGAVAGCWRSESDVVVHAFHALMSPDQLAWRAICAKELLAQVTWLERFGPAYRGAVILFGTDNAGNVFTVNKLRVDAEDAIMAGLLSRLLAVADACDVECLVWWCPRALNGISDDLSKCSSLVDARRIAESLRVVLHA